MVRKKIAVMFFVATAFVLGSLVPESQAVEAVVATTVVKKIDKIETLTRVADNVIETDAGVECDETHCVIRGIEVKDSEVGDHAT